MLELRDYQAELIERTRAALKRHPSVCIQLGTGGGKTALGAYMMRGVRERGRKGWFLVHRDFLIDQTLAAFARVDIDAGTIAAGRPFDPWKSIYVVSLPTLVRRYQKLQPPDFAIIDEAHHVASKSWSTIAAWLSASRCRIVGLTATPSRLDGRGLDRWFRELLCGPVVADLIALGHLSSYRAFAPSAPNLTGVHTTAGDYNRGELSHVMDAPQIVGDVVAHYQQLAAGKRAIYFCTSVRHSLHVAEAFNSAGVAARHLDATSSSMERGRAALDLACGRVRVLTNCELFGEGYDLAAQAGAEVSVEAVGLVRPTQSLCLHLQQCGRALRPQPERAIILDHAGNIARHGLPDTEREWSLAGVEGGRSKEPTKAIRICPECFFAHPPAPHCPECGCVYPVEAREVEEAEGVLEEIDREAYRKMERRQVGRARSLEALLKIEKQRGYRPGWAQHVMRARAAKQGARV